MLDALAIAILCLVPGQVERPDVPAEKVAFADLSADERLELLKKEAAKYSLFVDSEDSEKLVLAEPVLRFNDNVSGVIDAVQLLWLRDKRPQATASFWRRKDGLIAHEFQSLSESRVLAKRDDKAVWHPLAPGVEPKPLDGAPNPANSAPGRLSQMRAAARQFSAAVVNQSGNRSLRLLSQPVSCHGEENAAVLDAGWFVFAKGTNPELMLLIEARRGDDNSYAWHYSPVRMTSAACELKRDDSVVWRVERNRGELPDGTYFNIYARE
ncbi:MAG: hypothetical protein H8E66_20275 [Planctomycetes bacterium]|nr:hypothetical protein [Planctomycetota bacterium]